MAEMNEDLTVDEERDRPFPRTNVQAFSLNFVEDVFEWSAESAGRKAMPLKERGDKTYRFHQNGNEFDLVEATSLEKSPKVMVRIRNV